MKSPSPLAAVVAKNLRYEVMDGTIPVGSALPTERALADRHGVSRTIVREAVATLAEEGLLILRDRCRPIVADQIRRSIPTSRSPNLAIWLWPYADDYIASSIFRGIQRAARGTHARLVMASASHGSWDDVLDSEARFLRGLSGDVQIDGAILWYLGSERNLPALLEAKRNGVRFVFVDRKPPEGFEADYVGTENLTAAQNLVNHLLELGHRRITFVGNIDKASSVAERAAGYRRALEEAGRWPDGDMSVLHNQLEGESEATAARRTAETILAQQPRPTAVFAVNDIVALALFEAFRDLGVRVPEDISLVGFDGLLRWVPGGSQLTTAVQNFARIGELAAETLLQNIGNPASNTFRHILLDAPLSVANSSAAPGPI